MNKLYLFLVLSICPIFAVAQNTNKVWVMASDLGVDFNTSPPTAFSAVSATIEGSASVSDNNGQLLMYTDGNVLYNRNHQPMPNGSGLQDLPQPAVYGSCSQGALIVPMPGNPLKYYVFTLEGYEYSAYTTGGSLWYSVVDMSLDNGLGDVIQGQKTILKDTCLQEKMTAVAGCNNNVWVMVRPKYHDEFRAYEITANGISTLPVVSQTSSQAQLEDYMGGVIKFSPDGTRMVSANTNYLTTQRSSVQLFDFDKGSGQLSNLITLTEWPEVSTAYGACFSPDGSKLYISDSLLYVWQYDLSQPTLPDIISSKTLLHVAVPGPRRVGDMQIGPDGRIYVSNLDAITQPDVAGTGCNYVVNAIDYSTIPASTYFGLPNVIVNPITGGNIAYRPVVHLRDTVICLNGPAQVSVTADVSNATPDAIYEWGPAAAIISANGNMAIVNSAISPDPYLNVISGITGDLCKQGSDADTMHITRNFCGGCKVYLANAFSPNGDGLNDRFALQTDGPDCGSGLQYVFSIYDRWGTLLFKETNHGPGWDGTYKGVPANSGTYYYYLHYQSTTDKERSVMKGDVTLVY